MFRKEVIPEALTAYKWRLPDTLKVSIKQSQDGGYVIFIENLPGCVTQAENGQEIFEMVNDAVLTYLELPSHYKQYLPTYLPSEEIRKKFNIMIPSQLPAQFLERQLVFERV